MQFGVAGYLYPLQAEYFSKVAKDNFFLAELAEKEDLIGGLCMANKPKEDLRLVGLIKMHSASHSLC